MRQALHFLKATGLMSLILLLSSQTFAQTATPPPAGDGSESNPYEIATLENLYWLSQSDTAWDKHYIQTADINASPTEAWDNNHGFSPVGNNTTEFSGTYNGQHNKINGLYIDRKNGKNIGLFGLAKGELTKIEKLALINVNITGSEKVGAIAGNNRGKIHQCYATGDVRSTHYLHTHAGGLAGFNADTIKSSFNNVNVSSAGHLTGGIAGKTGGSSLIINCYSQGEVSGFDHIGGIVGENYNGKVKYCYSTSPVSGREDVGGIVGAKYSGVTKNSFWDTETSGQKRSAGGTGKTTIEMKYPYTFIDNGWDFMNETDNGEDNIWGVNPNENGGYPFLSWQGYTYQTPLVVMTQEVTNIDKHSAIGNIKILLSGESEIISHGVCWDTTATPTIEDNYTDEGSISDTGAFTSNIAGLNDHTTYYVRSYSTNTERTVYGQKVIFRTLPSYTKPSGEGTKANPYQIANHENLTWLMLSDTAWDKHYIQTADIDASATNNWYSGKGFIPVGNSNTKFTGTYNGKLHNIDSLFIDRPTTNNVGLFGIVKESRIDSLGLKNLNITGNKNVGGLLGYNDNGTITTCFVTGNVSAETNDWYTRLGGIVGNNLGTFKNSYSSANVSADASHVGGFAGQNSGSLNNCYSSGSVSGAKRAGGLVGNNKNSINKCYSTAVVAGDNSSIGGLVGYKESGSSASNSFWDTETSGQKSSAGGTGKTTIEMKNPYTFIDNAWDFISETNNGENDFWGINSNKNEGYPFLAWQGFNHQIPVLIETQEVTNIDSISATGNIKILSPRKPEITAYGVCWDTTTTPTLEDNYTDEGSVSDTGAFTSKITGLNDHTTYYVRSYATNIDTTVYGNKVTFTTLHSYSKPEGEGTENNPYQIANLDNLTWLMLSDTAWDKHYIQTADIDASETNSWYSGKGFIPIGNSNTEFSGTYNGQSHKIDSLYINRKSSKNIGLFGLAKGELAKIEKLALINVNVIGKENVGAIAGHNRGKIFQCYASGNVNSNVSGIQTKTGGLAGINVDTIQSSFNNVNVSSAGHLTGGITGKNGGSGLLINCYSQGDVSGVDHIGGVVGENYNGKIKDCYSTSLVDGKSYVGGIVGRKYDGVTKDSFWDKETSGQNSSAGGAGSSTSDMHDINNYIDADWDFINTWGWNASENNSYPFLKWQGYSNDLPLIVKTDEIVNADTSSATVNGSLQGLGDSQVKAYGVCWNKSGTPEIDEDTTNLGSVDTARNFICEISGLETEQKYFVRTYAKNNDTLVYGKEQAFSTLPSYNIPVGDGTEANPYQIASLENLTWLMASDTIWDKHYIQTADIDASATNNWYSGKGFIPVGNSNTKFTGTYNGKLHNIDSLFIDRPTTNNVGLFGIVKESRIDSLGLKNLNITGNKNVGGLLGYNDNGTITTCFVTGNVSAETNDWYTRLGGIVGNNLGTFKNSYSSANVSADASHVGGFAGQNSGSLNNCYSSGSVSGAKRAGGLVGNNKNSINKCYSTAVVAGDNSSIGGLVGYKESGSSASNSFWDTETSGQKSSAGGTGKTTIEMKNPYTFIDNAWDFISETNNGENDFWGINSNKNEGYPFLAWQGFNHQIPVLIETQEVTNIDSISATGNIKILSPRKPEITAYGVCWDTTTTPTLEDNYTDEGSVSDTGAFTSKITGLNDHTTYYVRSYATNIDTTVYGNKVTFTTLHSYSKPEGEGTENNPYQIANLDNLTWLMLSDTAWDKHYIQTADIDASETNSWYSGKGFIPIGNSNTEFSGTYNGQSHKIDSLYINRESSKNIGLFGLAKGDLTQIEKLALTNVNVTGKQYVGAIAGHNRGKIYQCYASGNVNSNVSGIQTNTGGLAGFNVDTLQSSFSRVDVTSAGHLTGGIVGKNGGSGLIINCYSQGEVSGVDHIGGIAGENWNGKIKDCYSTSPVSGREDVGGIVGAKYSGVTKNSFWNTETSGQNSSAGGTGLITSEMQDFNNYIDADWGFINTWGWNTSENNSYPFLKWQGYSNDLPLIVKTKEIITTDSSSATISASLLSPGDADLTAYGVCWNKSGAPTVDDDTTNLGSVDTARNFISKISELETQQKYFARAYAKNNDTIVYGKELAFSTLPSYSIPVGEGTEANPYQIASLENLTWLMASDTAWDKHFIQTADIDASSTNNWYCEKGFIPVGNSNTKFTGTYNGQLHNIDSLFIDRPTTNKVGLFGIVKDGRIDSLGITNLNITGNKDIGGLLGYNDNGTITTCFTTGNVSAESNDWYTRLGGMVGNNVGTFTNSYSSANVSADASHVGGFAGQNSGSLDNCYSTGHVSGSNRTGGLVGNNKNSIKKCYSTAVVTGNNNSIGGLVGHKESTASASNSFWDKEASGQNSSAGGTGKSTIEMKNPYTFIDDGWDFISETNNGEGDIWGVNPNENNGYTFLAWQGFTHQIPFLIETQKVTNIDSISATGNIKIHSPREPEITAYGVCWDTTATPTLEDNYTDEGNVSNTGTFASNIPGLNDHTTYYVRSYATNIDTTIYGNELTFTTLLSYSKPEGEGTENNPYLIANLNNLTWLMLSDTAWDKHYIQTADIDASETNCWYSGKGFIPIGNSTTEFSGTYNGQSHKIDSLYINRESGKNIGLFGMVKGDLTQIEKLALMNVNVTGKENVGAIAGNNRGKIYQCYASGNVKSNVSGIQSKTGGLAGLNVDTIQSSFNKVNVSSAGHLTGGIAGKNGDSGLIINCYSQGEVSGVDHIGGIVGENYNGKIKECYSTSLVNGRSYVGGIVGRKYDGVTKNSFWDTETSGQNSSDGGTGLSTSEMQDFNNYIDAGWDFINTWGWNESENNSYPFLKWQGFSAIPFEVSTIEIVNITVSSATINGSLTIMSHENPTSHGICWNKSGVPTIDDDTTNLGSVETAINFSSQIHNLEVHREYVARAYATNADTTIYGDEIIFTTLRKELSISGNFSVADKEYDGTTDATITENNLTLKGIKEGDEVNIKNVSASFAQAEKGTDISVSIDNVELGGSNAGDYSVSLTDAPTTTADITETTDIINAATDKVKLYPNPFRDFIMIESEREIIKVEITDMSGTTSIIENPERRINTSKLEDGIYLIILEDDQGIRYRRKMTRQ